MPIPILQDEQEQVLVIDNFKTMNRKVKEDLLPPDTAQTCQNLRYDEVLGMIYKRPSRRKYNSTTLGTDPITSQIRYYKNSDNSKKYVIATATFLKVGTDDAGTFANIKTGLTTNQKFTFITFKDFLYCFNGVDTNLVYDGTNVENMGVPIPTAPTLAAVGGSLTGAYYYKVTYMLNSYQEGSASTASSVINLSTQGVTVTIPTSANTRVTHRKIYRTKAGGSIYYLLATISDNTTTTYGDNIADGSLSATQAPTDYGAPGSYRYGVLHKSRIFLARNSTNKSDIIFSDIRSGVAHPDVFPADNILHIAKDDGDEITGISEDNVGNLVVWKTNSVRIIHTDGESPKGWSIGKPYTNFGNIAPYFLVKTPIGVIYMTRFGENKNRLMLWSGIGVKHILEELDPVLDDIDPAGVTNTVGHFHNGKIYISYTDTSEFPEIAIDSYTKLLIHWNEADGSTTPDDASASNHTITANGNVQTDSGVTIFTNTSLFDGVGDYWSIANHSDFSFGTSDLTLELLMKWTALPGTGNTHWFFTKYANAGNDRMELYVSETGGQYKLGFYSRVSGGNIIDFTTPAISLSTGVKYHIAFVRNGNNFYFFLNGILQGSGFTSANTIGGFTAPLLIGERSDSPYAGDLLKGNADEARISTIARWTSNFIPPTTQYGYGYNNKVLVIDAETLLMINIDKKSIDSFSSWNSGTDMGELYSGTSNTDGFCYEEETDTNASESTIEINYKWGKLNFDQPRLRKRLKQVKIEFNRTVTSGTLSYFYSLDGATETQVDIALATYASQGYYLYDFPVTAYCFHIQPRLYSNSDISALGIKRLTYIYNYEPFLQTI